MKTLLTLTALGLCWPISNSAVASIIVGNGGFETVTPVNYYPLTAYGVWTGNPGEMVTAENGISPLEGSHMLKFTGTMATTNIWQLVDVTSLPAGSEIKLSAAFNRLAGSPSLFQLRIAALNHGPPSNGNPELDETAIAIVQQNVPDNTWTTLSLSAVLPANTVMVGIEVAYQGLTGYADNVQLTPEPSSVVLAALGFISVGAWSWHRRTRTKPL